MKIAIAMLLAGCIAISMPLNAEAQKGWKSYTVEDEFSFKYPISWDLRERENRFTNIDASLDYDKGGRQLGTIGFAHDPKITERFDASKDGEILNELESRLLRTYSANIFEKGSDKYIFNNQTAPYVIGTYSKPNLFGPRNDYVAMLIAIKLGQGDAVLAQFTASQNDFDKLLGNVEKIFLSVRPVNSTVGNL